MSGLQPATERDRVLAQMAQCVDTENVAINVGWLRGILGEQEAANETLRHRVQQLEERIGPVSPQGDDRIDELESCIGFLRHDVEARDARVRELELRRGCECKCCPHGEGSDCACDCHATGRCAHEMVPNGPGTLMVGVKDGDVVIELPRDMTGFIVFSVQQAHEFAHTVVRQALIASGPPDPAVQVDVTFPDAEAVDRAQYPQDYPEHGGPNRWQCKRCKGPRRRSGCLSCGDDTPLTDEPRVPGVVR